jgi:hypothetical protein
MGRANRIRATTTTVGQASALTMEAMNSSQFIPSPYHPWPNLAAYSLRPFRESETIRAIAAFRSSASAASMTLCFNRTL